MKKIVLDTNVIISAFLGKGYPRTIYDLVKEGEILLLSSKQIEAEFIRVLAYHKFGLSSSEIIPLVNELREYTHFVEVKNKLDIVKKDPTDNIFIECALDGKADFIIIGDHHLLEINIYQGIPILKAKDFLTNEGFIKLSK